MNDFSPPTSTARRCRLQFKLRTLLALVLLCAVACGWMAHKRKQARQEREAAKAIGKLGGFVVFVDGRASGFASTGLTWARRLLADDLFGTTQCALVNSTAITDADVAHVAKLTQLVSLQLHATQVTDAGLRHLRGLTTLERLDLGNTQVTDAGLEHLRGLAQLRDLELSGTRVTDVGLGSLRGLTQLRRIRLNDTAVTDRGLRLLRSLSQLRELQIVHTQVTDAGAAELKEALPNAEINHVCHRSPDLR